MSFSFRCTCRIIHFFPPVPQLILTATCLIWNPAGSPKMHSYRMQRSDLLLTAAKRKTASLLSSCYRWMTPLTDAPNKLAWLWKRTSLLLAFQESQGVFLVKWVVWRMILYVKHILSPFTRLCQGSEDMIGMTFTESHLNWFRVWSLLFASCYRCLSVPNTQTSSIATITAFLVMFVHNSRLQDESSVPSQI